MGPIALLGLVALAFAVYRVRPAPNETKGSDPLGHKASPSATAAPPQPEPVQGIHEEPSLLEEINRCLTLCRREGRDLAVLVLGIDGSPGVDEIGEPTESLGRSLDGLCRSRGTTLLRTHHSQFVVLATDLVEGEALKLSQDLTRSVSDLSIPCETAPAGILTLSVGAAIGHPEPDSDVATFLAAARRCLSKAQGRGGSRVVFEML